MIITCQNLLNIFKLIYYENHSKEYETPGTNPNNHSKRSLQIRFIEDQVEFAVLYDINVFISIILDRRFLDDNCDFCDKDIYLKEEYFHKLYMISKYYPHNSIDINSKNESEINNNIVLSLIENKEREKSFFQKDQEIQLKFLIENTPEFIVEPPIIQKKSQCSVVADAFRKLLECCCIENENIIITLFGEDLIVKNCKKESKDFVGFVNSDEIVCSTKVSKNNLIKSGEFSIILEPERRDLLIKILKRIFINKIVNLYMFPELPFIVENETLRIYMGHVS